MAPIQLSQIYPRRQVYYDIIIPIYFIIKHEIAKKRKTDVPFIDTPAFNIGESFYPSIFFFLSRFQRSANGEHAPDGKPDEHGDID